MSPTAAELELKGTVSGDKNEILFKRFQINYNNELQFFRKGTVIYRDYGQAKPDDNQDGFIPEHETSSKRKIPDPTSKSQLAKERKKKMKATIQVDHVDIIGETFWQSRSWILTPYASRAGEE